MDHVTAPNTGKQPISGYSRCVRFRASMLSRHAVLALGAIAGVLAPLAIWFAGSTLIANACVPVNSTLGFFASQFEMITRFNCPTGTVPFGPHTMAAISAALVLTFAVLYAISLGMAYGMLLVGIVRSTIERLADRILGIVPISCAWVFPERLREGVGRPAGVRRVVRDHIPYLWRAPPAGV